MQVKADGAIASTEVWVEWRYPTYIGMTSTSGTGSNLEDSTWMNVFNVTGTAIDVVYDNLTIYSMEGYIHSDGADDREVRAYAYNWTTNTDAGAKFGESVETWLETPTGAYSWKGGTLTTPIVLNDDRIFFYGLYAIAEGGSYVLAHPSLGGYYVYRNAIADDPFTETTNGANAYSIRFAVEGDYNTSTTHNQYYGTVTDYVARRDVNYTFPTGADNRQIRFVYSNSEAMRNITYSNGGLWDSLIPSSEYTDVSLNATHKVVTLDNADIGNYGGDLRFFTQSHAYVYNIDGGYYENGTNYGDVNITANTVTETETVEITGETTYGSSNEVLFFSWTLSGGGTRRLYTPFQSETFNVFYPEDTYATYDFEIKDYTGKHLLGNRYLEAYRSVNTTLELIERMQILTGNSVPLSLVTGKTYVIRFLWGDQTRTTWGYFVPGVDPTPTLIVRGTSFTEQAYTASNFINLEATRPSSTTITVDYEDTRVRTVNVSISIRIRNGAVVHTYSSTEDSFTYNWGGAGASTGYIVAITGEHEDLSEWGYTKILDQDETFPDPPDLTGIFTFGGFDATTILAFGLTLTALLTASYSYREQGLLFAMAMASFMSYIGWANWSYDLLALGWFFSILVVLVGRRLR